MGDFQDLEEIALPLHQKFALSWFKARCLASRAGLKTNQKDC
jgi:hypothetical protein